MTARRILLFFACFCLVLAVAPFGGRSALAAPMPSSLTLTAGAGAVPFSGGPITGSADASGNTQPPACQEPVCESIPVTLAGPSSPANALYLTVTIHFTPVTGNPGGVGLDGLDIWIIDSGGNNVGAATLGSSPATAIAAKLNPGSYTLQITGENAAANETYTGLATATVGPPPSGGVVTFSPTPLTFAPATVVSPSILGAEPQISFERPVANPAPNAGFDVNRGFVDWPVSSRTQIGTLWRTTNGGDSYRQIVDLTCAERQSPTCLTGGGGDTVNRVNNYDGTVDFGNQESLVQEAFASSIDHGDTFPAARQASVTSLATGVDRQWISTVDAPNILASDDNGVTTYQLQAIFSYHIPDAGEEVAGVDNTGLVHIATHPVIPNVTQSGPSRMDSQAGSPGFGWFYQGYRDAGGFEVAAAQASQYNSPSAYVVNNVSSDTVETFPWIALDRAGNLYALWTNNTDGQLYFSVSPITDSRNDPALGGRPATFWTPKSKVNPPSVGSTVFPEIVAGDPGHIAIAFMGTHDWTGQSDGAPAGAKWTTYALISGDALDTSPTFQVGVVSHRIDHIGSVCSIGTTCPTENPPTGGDRSLLDMIDVTMDSDGRTAVVFMDNNNSFGRQEQTAGNLGSQGTPFVKVAKLATGPSLLTGHGPYAFSYPTDFRAAASGDATWPNTASGTNLPTLDITGAGATLSGSNLVGRIDLSDTTAADFATDLNSYNNRTPQGGAQTDPPASRFQYVLRWDFSNDETYYMVAEVNPTTGAPTFYGGKVDQTNAVNNGTAPVGIAYRNQSAYPVSGQIQGNSLVLTAPASEFGVSSGSTLVSFAAYSLVGPADTALGGNTENQTSQVFVSMRTVDSSPPIDAVLGSPSSSTPEAPWVPLLALAGFAGAVALLRTRRRATP